MFRTVSRRVFILIFCLALAAPIIFGQQPAAPAFKDATVLPQGMKGERVRSYIEVINSGRPRLSANTFPPRSPS
jgi:hypothetical protein